MLQASKKERGNRNKTIFVKCIIKLKRKKVKSSSARAQVGTETESGKLTLRLPVERVGSIILRIWGLKFKQVLGVGDDPLGFSELRFGTEALFIKL